MQSKTAFVEKYLLDRIRSGEYLPGSKIPSQHQLMNVCKCSRITVQRALKILMRDGFLHTGKGSGTFVLSGPYSAPLREIIVIVEKSPQYSPHSEMIPEKILPARWIDVKFAMRNYEKFFYPGQAVIWPTAQEGHIMLMQYLRSRGISQLLINRTYENLDYVTLDSVASIAEGLRWLQSKSGKKIAFITHDPDYTRPYLAERVISFYEACAVTGTEVMPQWIFRRDFSDRENAFNAVGRELFGGRNIPRGICVLHMDLVDATVQCAGKYGLELGRDFFVLAFDMVHKYKNHPGLTMMIQPKYRFREGVKEWLEYRMAGKTAPFAYRIKTELQINR